MGAHTGAPSISIFVDSDDEGERGEDHALEMEMKAVNRSRSGKLHTISCATLVIY